MQPSQQRHPGNSTTGALSASPEDGALLARMAERDTAAFVMLYDRHAPLVFGAAMHLLADPLAAERAVEATFLSLWREGPAIDPAGTAPRIWLLAELYRHARDCLGLGGTGDGATVRGIAGGIQAADSRAL